MGIKKLTDEVTLVELPSQGSRRSEELKAVNEVVSSKNDSDMIMDFSRVEIINSWDISNLLILQNLLNEVDHNLVLFDLTTVTKCIFVVAGLAEVFTFADSKEAALESVEKIGSHTKTSG